MLNQLLSDVMQAQREQGVPTEEDEILVAELEETQRQFIAMEAKAPAMNQLLLDMQAAKDSEAPREVVDALLMRFAAVADDDWVVRVPAMESSEVDMYGELDIAMEGIKEGFGTIYKLFRKSIAGVGDLISRGLNKMVARFGKLEKHLEKQVEVVKALDGEPNVSTIEVTKGAGIIHSDGSIYWPSKKEIEDMVEKVTQWSDVKALKEAIEASIESMKDPENTKAFDRVSAIQENLVAHYKLGADTRKSAKTRTKWLGRFKKVGLVSEEAMLGGLRIRGMAAIPEGETEVDMGKLYVNHLDVDYNLRKDAPRSPELRTPTPEEIQETHEACVKALGLIKDLKANNKEALKVLDTFDKELNKMKKLSNIDWAYIAGVTILGLGIGAKLWISGIVYGLLRRYMDSIGNINNGIYAHAGITLNIIADNIDVAVKAYDSE